MFKITFSKGRRCFFFHSFKLIKDTGKTKYLECIKCKTKKIIQSSGGYQPVDLEWLYEKKENKKSRMPPKRS